MANKGYGAISHIGGADGDLDAISESVLTDGDVAIVVDAVNNTLDVYTCVAADSGVEDAVNFTIVVPDDASTPGFRWYKVLIKSWNGTNVSDSETNRAAIAAQAIAKADRVAVPDTANLCGMDADGDPTDSSLVVAQTPQQNVADEWTAQQNFNESAITSSSNATAWDMDTAQCAIHTLTENTTISAPTNLNAGGTYYLRVVQAAGVYTLAWNAVFKWGSASTPAAPAADGDVVVFSFYSDGTSLYGVEMNRTEA